MSEPVTNLREALEALSAVASPDAIRRAAEEGLAPSARPKCNSHIHLPPNFSAFQSVGEAVGLATEQGIGVLGVSNYYDFGVYAEFVRLARASGIFPLFGLEIICLVDDLVRGGVRINDPGNPGKFYICGKGITRFADPTPRAAQLIGQIRSSDATRMAEMTEKIGAIFCEHSVALQLTENDVIDMIVRRHDCARASVTVQERHVAQAYQEALFAQAPSADERAALLALLYGEAPKAASDDAVGVQNEMRSRLMKAGKPAFVDETFVTFDEARELILELGGIPCYPTLADGVDPICEFEETPSALIANLRARNLHAAEFIPIRNKPEVLSQYVEAMRAEGIVVTGGTEHNTLDLIPIEPTCVGGAPVPEAVREIFWEGACVVAAHQFLTLRGQPGFVDAAGAPSANYATPEERIAAFAAVGRALIAKYYGAQP